MDKQKYWREPDGDITEWEPIVAFIKRENQKCNDWIFRGLPENENRLVSTFDRCLERIENQGIKIKDRWRYEIFLLYEFKRRAHYYLKESGIPKPQDFLEWFSLMRHFGSPSRLLDFTYSFYIALYFAVSASITNKDACVYGVNREWLNKKIYTDLVEKGEFFQSPRVFYKYAMVHPEGTYFERKPFIIPVRPFKSNERIHMQRGLFLCPANVNMTFEENLLRFAASDELKVNIFKIPIRKAIIPNIMNSLREMNLGSETLFPGLSGYASSLGDLFYLPENLWPQEERLKEAARETPEF